MRLQKDNWILRRRKDRLSNWGCSSRESAKPGSTRNAGAMTRAGPCQITRLRKKEGSRILGKPEGTTKGGKIQHPGKPERPADGTPKSGSDERVMDGLRLKGRPSFGVVIALEKREFLPRLREEERTARRRRGQIISASWTGGEACRFTLNKEGGSPAIS